jgi:hypothetical protein
MYKCMLVSIGVMVEVSKEQHSLYANAILCNLLGSENSHVCLLAMFCFFLLLLFYFVFRLSMVSCKGRTGKHQQKCHLGSFQQVHYHSSSFIIWYNDAH